ncbi:protein RFT1 homolog [Xenia sp. Carnegie-2017]|uniref:protein RFT1 homolog n=1 Tax=Xenia sp. Carnegie-2017 TaxID=2897299 RepID=UPI001F033599|nr:protein RFT1 homolog [Xenia sp. Carnegie-2017]
MSQERSQVRIWHLQQRKRRGFTKCHQTLVRDKPAEKQSQHSLHLAALTLECVLKFVLLVGLTIVVFGFSYSFLALDIYGGPVLSSGEGPMQLKWHCLYILVIAINGITECFMFATMPQTAVDEYNQKMLIFSIMFLLSSFVFTYFGAVGFILANCLNMSLRIFHSIIYINKYFLGTNHTPLKALQLSKPVVLSYAFSFIVTYISESFFCCSYGWFWRFCHVAVGGICLLIVAFTVYRSEEKLVQFVKERFFTKTAKSE